MKNHLLIILLFLLSFGLFTSSIAQTYTVEIFVQDIWWTSSENFKADVLAKIYRDGELIPPSSDYYYEWEAKFTNINPDQWEPHTSGYGEDGADIIAETLPGYDIYLKVEVTDAVNNTFNGTLGPESGGPYFIPEVEPGEKGVSVSFIPSVSLLRIST